MEFPAAAAVLAVLVAPLAADIILYPICDKDEARRFMGRRWRKTKYPADSE